MAPEKIGRYEIKSELGRGGMATVYLARDPHFKRDVAVKVLPREFLHDPAFRARFEREAQTIAQLEHPAIVPVYDFGGDTEADQPYIVMRYMPGGSLADRLHRGPLPMSEAARIVARLASALDEAHSKGIIHRDLKPANILFDQRDEPYISDFGIAKLSQASANFTGSAIIGTPAYMSPEQARGEKSLDGRSDIYALGVILYEMLAGKRPYEADTPIGQAVKHLTEPPPRLRDVRPDLSEDYERVVTQALAKKPDERFGTARALAAALETITPGGEATSPSARGALPAKTRPSPKPADGRGRIPAWGWILSAGIGLLAIFFFGRNLLTPTATPTPTASSSPTMVPTATLTPVPTDTATPTKAPTRTRVSTTSPTPTSAPPKPKVAYNNDFEGALGEGWSNASTDTTPSGRTFLGRFGNDPVSLTLTGLPDHTDVTVSFDLFIIGAWDGNRTDNGLGPDLWAVSVRGGLTLIQTTFGNGDPNSVYRQSYPGWYPDAQNPKRSGAEENNTLGYPDPSGFTSVQDSVYHLSFKFSHSVSTLTLDFAGAGLQSLDDESWGLDNLRVVVETSP